MSPCSAAVTYPEHKSFCEKTQTKLNQTKAKQKTPNPQQQRNTTNKKTQQQKNPQTTQQTFKYSAVLSLPKPCQAGIAAFSLPQVETEKSFVLDWPSSSLSVGDLLQTSPCSIPAVIYPFLQLNPKYIHMSHCWQWDKVLQGQCL